MLPRIAYITQIKYVELKAKKLQQANAEKVCRISEIKMKETNKHDKFAELKQPSRNNIDVHSFFYFYLKHCGSRVQNGLCCGVFHLYRSYCQNMYIEN